METSLPAFSPEAKEYRRFVAFRMHQQGIKQSQIAQTLGVTQGAVSQWMKVARQGGLEALKNHPPPGATPRLSEEDKQQLVALLEQGAEAFGFLGNLWTRPRVQKLIQDEFGVRYHVSYLSELLAKLGFTRQKPAKKARQQDEQAVAAWQEQRWPELKKKVPARGAHSRLRR